MRSAERYAFQLSSAALLRRPAPAKGAHRGCPPPCAEPLQGRGEGDRYRDAAESRRRIEAEFTCAEVDRGIAAGEPFELDTRLRGKDDIYRLDEGRARSWYLSATETESRKQEEERIRQENVRLEERTRIAQELHDTLLQTFQSASLHLGAAVLRLARDSPVKNQLDRTLEIMRQGIVEGRSAIQGLRSSGFQTSDLVGALSHIQDELTIQPDIDFRVTVTGRQKQLAREIQHEIYRIGREALANAFCHSRAKRIELELEYSDRELCVRIRDNGCGIEPQILEKRRDRHWGLAGMRERATRIGGVLKISSSPAAGTEVQLSIPTSSVEGMEGLNRNQNELQNRSSR
jgi:signal transduction histidine kinase